MSISPAQLIQQVASAESPTLPRRSTQASLPGAESPAETPTPAPAVPSPAPLSTDMRVDGQHQVYYAFVDDRTGDVIFEIPPEALREIAESLNLPLVGDSSVHGFDVKS